MIRNASMTKMTVDEMVHQLSRAYVSFITAGTQLKNFPSVMLWGPPGVGKSQGVRQIGKEIEEQTGKNVVITDVRLLLFNPVDLRGIPTANADKTLAVWLKPQIFQMDDSEDIINILLLDEISAAPQSVQASAYQITLDRMVGEHKLPENCIVIAAGNRVTDKSVAFNMPKALANRLCHIEIEADFDSWLDWAIRSGVNRNVIRFLKYKPQYIMDFEASNDSLAFATPRSWEMVSNIFNGVSENIDDVFPIVAGCIGVEAATEYQLWFEINDKMPDVKDVFLGKVFEIPSRAEAQYAISMQIIEYARTCKNKTQLHNAIDYVRQLPTEFLNKVFTEFWNMERLQKALLEHSAYSMWADCNIEWYQA